MNYKFDLLDFDEREDGIQGTTAKIFFKNGFGASVITGSMFYTSLDSPFELAVLAVDEDNWEITYSTPITDDVLGYLDEDGVDQILTKISKLPSTEEATL